MATAGTGKNVIQLLVLVYDLRFQIVGLSSGGD